MRNNYYSILLFLLSTFAIAQEAGDTPVDGFSVVKRVNTVTETVPSTTSQVRSFAAPMAAAFVSSPTGISSEVGITEGQLSVSLSGGATYSVPIAVPPGINGVVPQVGLVYNSQGGNGMAGYGWNISGVSAITRIPRTKFHDEVVGGVNLDNNDRFALDGQRLIVKNNGVYGAANTEYETENFSNLKITAIGVYPSGANYGPASFKVEYPDGSVAMYGATTDSRSITTWSITYWENAQGVRISYIYNNANNNLTIASIKYGAVGSNTPINEIQFVYVSRKRPEQSYVAGQSILMNTILSEIKVFGNSVGFRNYVLEPKQTYLGYEKLKSITEKSGDGTKSYNPTVFEYGKDDNASFLTLSPNVPQISLGNINSQNAGTVVADFDGDGVNDFIVYAKTGPDAFNKYWIYNNLQDQYLSYGFSSNVGSFIDIFSTSYLKGDTTNGYKLSAGQGWTVLKKNNNTFTFDTYGLSPVAPSSGYTHLPSLQHTKSVPFTNTGSLDGARTISGDFNGDGITDVIIIPAVESISEAHYDNWGYDLGYTYTYILPAFAYFVDLKKNSSGSYQQLQIDGQYLDNNKIEVIDFNNDGKSDLMSISDNVVYVYTLGDDNKLKLLARYADTALGSGKFYLLGDFNGDGKTDFAMPEGNDSSSWDFYIAKGDTSGFVKQTKTGPYYYNNYFTRTEVDGYGWKKIEVDTIEYTYVANDLNGDGKSEIIRLYNKTFNRYDKYRTSYGKTVFDGSDYTDSGRPIASNVTSYQNSSSGGNISFLQGDSESVSNIRVYPIPLFTNHVQPNLNLDFSILSDNKVYSLSSNHDNRKSTRIASITTGNGVVEKISYKPLRDNYDYNQGLSVYKPFSESSTYPNTDIVVAPGFQVVSILEKQSSTTYKKQLFSYAGATSNMEGLGFLGFRASMRTNWFEDQSQIISTVSKFDPNLRGANVASYTYKGLESPSTAVNTPAPNTPRTSAITIKDTRTTSQTVQATNSIRFLPGAKISPTAGNAFVAQITPNYDANGYAETNTTPPYNLISKSVSFYEASLSAAKVYNLKNTQSNTYNILENTSSETVTVYDNFNNPTESISKIRNGGVGEQTTTTALAYESVSSPYMVGRPASKTQTVTSSGDTMTSKETYGYGSGTESNLLKKIEKWGNNTSAITEANAYDRFGNITKKTISATGIADRVTDYKYEPTGRFLEESYDIEKLKTTYVYNPNGTLKSETNPYVLTTSYLYDPWFKKTTTTDYMGKSNTYDYTRSENVKTKVTTTGDDGSYSEELYDDLGRKEKSGVRDLQNTMSYKDYKYDIYDRNYSTSEPHTGTASLWNTTTYDVYGRPEKVTDFKGKVMSMVYDKLTTTITDGSTMTTKKATKNAMGNLVQMEEKPGGIIKYSYFANGNLKETDYAGTKITLTQDGWGRKTSLKDPSAGTYTYEYNALGEMTKETTPNGTTTYKLDDWGKPDLKTIVGLNTDSKTKYHYYPDSKLLQKTEYTDAKDAGNTISTDFYYDDKKRLKETIETTGYGAVFTKRLSYDAWGRVDTETSKAELNGKSSEKVIQNDYKNGFAYKITDKQSLKTLWETKEINARGQLTKATLGNGIGIENKYDTSGFGYLAKTTHTLTATAATVMELTNDFDLQRGNLNWRENSLFGSVRENFTYDSLDRLKTYPDASGTVTQNYYDDGRIKDNTIGTYNYANAQKKYQNTSVTLSTDALAYYKNRGIAALPSPTATRALTITYNTFKSPVEITEDGVDKISFVYNDNNSRSAMFYGSANTDKNLRPNRKYYSADGTMEIKITPAGTEFVTYIGGDGYSAPVVYKKTFNTAGNAQEQMLYLHRDYQGSIIAITNEVGAIVEKRLFDAWGSLLSIQNGSSQPIANGQWLLDRGYTGHEHLMSVGLIHMNGRLYDPKLHRFLQPDNYVQDPTNTQNFNRYGYVLNNPLKYIDPTGETGDYPGKGLFDCKGCGYEQQPHYYTPEEQNNNAQFAKGLLESPWFSKNLSARNFDEAGTAVGKAFRDATNWVTSGIAGWFGNGKSSAPAVQVAQQGNADIHMPTQHNSFGFNWTYLSQSNAPFNQMIYGVANSVNIPVQYMMGRGVGDGSMRNLDGTSTSTDEGVMAFVSVMSLSTFGIGNGAVSATKGGSTFFQSAKYSDKVLRQMNKADDLFHGFPKSVDGFATKYGQWSTKIGGDGKAYQWLKMKGSYGGKTGVFEYTKDANGIINHRFFNVTK